MINHTVCCNCGHSVKPYWEFCLICGLKFDPYLIKQISHLDYLLVEIGTWSQQNLIDFQTQEKVTSFYINRRKDLLAQFLPDAQKEKTQTAIKEPEDVFVSKNIENQQSIFVQPSPLNPIVKPANTIEQQFPPAPVLPRKSWIERLSDPQTLRWMVYSGASLFVIGTLVYLRDIIGQQLQRPIVQAGALALFTLTVLTLGIWLLKRTSEELAGRGLVFLGSLLIPINPWFLTYSGLIEKGNHSWIVGLICTAIYGIMTALLSEALLLYLALPAAILTIFGFLGSVFGVSSDIQILVSTAFSIILLHLEQKAKDFEIPNADRPFFHIGHLFLATELIMYMCLYQVPELVANLNNTPGESVGIISHLTSTAIYILSAYGYLFTAYRLRLSGFAYITIALLLFTVVSELIWFKASLPASLVILSSCGLINFFISKVVKLAYFQDSSKLQVPFLQVAWVLIIGSFIFPLTVIFGYLLEPSNISLTLKDWLYFSLIGTQLATFFLLPTQLNLDDQNQRQTNKVYGVVVALGLVFASVVFSLEKILSLSYGTVRGLLMLYAYLLTALLIVFEHKAKSTQSIGKEYWLPGQYIFAIRKTAYSVFALSILLTLQVFSHYSKYANIYIGLELAGLALILGYATRTTKAIFATYFTAWLSLIFVILEVLKVVLPQNSTAVNKCLLMIYGYALAINSLVTCKKALQAKEKLIILRWQTISNTLLASMYVVITVSLSSLGPSSVFSNTLLSFEIGGLLLLTGHITKYDVNKISEKMWLYANLIVGWIFITYGYLFLLGWLGIRDIRTCFTIGLMSFAVVGRIVMCLKKFKYNRVALSLSVSTYYTFILASSIAIFNLLTPFFWLLIVFLLGVTFACISGSFAKAKVEAQINGIFACILAFAGISNFLDIHLHIYKIHQLPYFTLFGTIIYMVSYMISKKYKESSKQNFIEAVHIFTFAIIPFFTCIAFIGLYFTTVLSNQESLAVFSLTTILAIHAAIFYRTEVIYAAVITAALTSLQALQLNAVQSIYFPINFLLFGFVLLILNRQIISKFIPRYGDLTIRLEYSSHVILALSLFSLFLQGICWFPDKQSDQSSLLIILMSAVVLTILAGIILCDLKRHAYMWVGFAFGCLLYVRFLLYLNYSLWKDIELFSIPIGIALLIVGNINLRRSIHSSIHIKPVGTFCIWQGSILACIPTLLHALQLRFFQINASTRADIAVEVVAILMIGIGILWQLRAPFTLGIGTVLLHLAVVIIQIVPWSQFRYSVFMAILGSLLFVLAIFLSRNRHKLGNLQKWFLDKGYVYRETFSQWK